MTLFVCKSATDVRETSCDSLVDSQATANQRADARGNLGVQGARVAASDLETCEELARTTRGKMLTPDASKVNRQR
jgi:hypothetical protein